MSRTSEVVSDFHFAFNELKDKAKSILIRAYEEKGIDRIELEPHGMECSVFIEDRFDCIDRREVYTIGISKDTEHNVYSFQIETDLGWDSFSMIEGWSDIQLYIEIIHCQLHLLEGRCLSKG